MPDKKLIAFDMDGTLADSKQPISEEMIVALATLSTKYYVAIISGCSFEQFRWQFMKSWYEVRLKHSYNVFLLPTCGAQMRDYGGLDIEWEKPLYNNNLTFRQKCTIVKAFEFANQECHYPVKDEPFWPGEHGELYEDRDGQVTFSMLGQQAPLELKEAFDPDCSIRKKLSTIMEEQLGPEFSVKIGGTTSIDVSKKGIDKEYGMNQLLKHLDLKPEDALYIGDRFDPGGNDEPVKRTGVECIEVSNPTEALGHVENLLSIK